MANNLLFMMRLKMFNFLKPSAKYKNLCDKRCWYGHLSNLHFESNKHFLELQSNVGQTALYGTRGGSPQQLLVKSFGEPKEVVVKEPFSISTPLGEKQVLVKMLACPVNPADINTIQGVYAIKLQCPFIPGNEGIMEIVDKGKDVNQFSVGDRIIPRLNAMGTWRTMAIFQEENLIKIPSDIDVVTGATLAINPCTAYRMLKDFINLIPGDFVIQNCANSAVGEAVIQIAAALNIKTINIIRSRPNFREVEDHLINLGATLVIADSDLRTSREIKKLPKPRLALNGASGRSGTDLMRQLVDGSTMVTYGGMSRQPLTVPVGSLIFNDIILRGYWMTRWNKQHERDSKRTAMFDDLFELIRSGKLKPPPHTLVVFDNFQKALEDAMPSTGMLGKKQILDFS